MPVELLFQKENRLSKRNPWEATDDDAVILGPVAFGQTSLFNRPDIGIKGISVKLTTSVFGGIPHAEVTIGKGLNYSDPANQAADVLHERMKIEDHRSGGQSTFAYIAGNAEETDRWSVTLKLSR